MGNECCTSGTMLNPVFYIIPTYVPHEGINPKAFHQENPAWVEGTAGCTAGQGATLWVTPPGTANLDMDEGESNDKFWTLKIIQCHSACDLQAGRVTSGPIKIQILRPCPDLLNHNSIVFSILNLSFGHMRGPEVGYGGCEARRTAAIAYRINMCPENLISAKASRNSMLFPYIFIWQ